MLRLRTLMIGLVALGGLLLANAAIAQQRPGQRPGAQRQAAPPTFMVQNGGSSAIREFYASPPTDANWGNDRLGSDMIAPGQTYRLQLPRGFGCEQDLRAVFEDGSTIERRGTNICQERTQIFRNAETDSEVTVQNGTPRTLFQLFIRPLHEDEWGPDRLGNDTIDPGEEGAVRFSAGGTCEFDIRVVFDNDSAEERRGVNLCETHAIAIIPGWTTADEVPTEVEARRPAPDQPPAAPPARRAPPAAPSPSAPAPQAGTTTFQNLGTSPIVRLSIDPPGARAPGPDRLGDAVIGPGASLAVAGPEGLCVGDVTATFRDGSTARRAGAALCDGEEISLP